jgi:hypothetical protein
LAWLKRSDLKKYFNGFISRIIIKKGQKKIPEVVACPDFFRHRSVLDSRASLEEWLGLRCWPPVALSRSYSRPFSVFLQRRQSSPRFPFSCCLRRSGSVPDGRFFSSPQSAVQSFVRLVRAPGWFAAQGFVSARWIGVLLSASLRIQERAAGPVSGALRKRFGLQFGLLRSVCVYARLGSLDRCRRLSELSLDFVRPVVTGSAKFF